MWLCGNISCYGALHNNELLIRQGKGCNHTTPQHTYAPHLFLRNVAKGGQKLREGDLPGALCLDLRPCMPSRLRAGNSLRQTERLALIRILACEHAACHLWLMRKHSNMASKGTICLHLGAPTVQQSVQKDAVAGNGTQRPASLRLDRALDRW